MDSTRRKIDARFDDPLFILQKILGHLYSFWISRTYPFASKGSKLYIQYGCELSRYSAPYIRLGSCVQIRKDAWLNVVAVKGDQVDPIIVLDDDCVIARRCVISAKNGVHLERGVMLAPSVLIMDHNHAHESLTGPIVGQGVSGGGKIRIGEGSWIGHAAAIVCDKGELVLGRNCVVAANAVVTRSAPPYSVLSGNPARVVKQFDPAKQVWVLGSSRATDTAPAK